MMITRFFSLCIYLVTGKSEIHQIPIILYLFNRNNLPLITTKKINYVSSSLSQFSPHFKEQKLLGYFISLVSIRKLPNVILGPSADSG
jgi:hypothetical protein